MQRKGERGGEVEQRGLRSEIWERWGRGVDGRGLGREVDDTVGQKRLIGGTVREKGRWEFWARWTDGKS